MLSGDNVIRCWLSKSNHKYLQKQEEKCQPELVSSFFMDGNLFLSVLEFKLEIMKCLKIEIPSAFYSTRLFNSLLLCLLFRLMSPCFSKF